MKRTHSITRWAGIVQENGPKQVLANFADTSSGALGFHLFDVPSVPADDRGPRT